MLSVQNNVKTIEDVVSVPTHTWLKPMGYHGDRAPAALVEVNCPVTVVHMYHCHSSNPCRHCTELADPDERLQWDFSSFAVTDRDIVEKA